jgi:hypothetical protein
MRFPGLARSSLITRLIDSSMWCNVVNYQGLIHAEDGEEWEGHEGEKHAGSSCIDQFSAGPFTRLSKILRSKKKVLPALIVGDAADRYVTDRTLTSGEDTLRT